MPDNRPLGRTIGYTVREIATPVEDLHFWTDEYDQVQRANPIQDANQEAFTYLPVQQDRRITGFVRYAASGASEFIPLSADWLIAADTPILHLIELFAEAPDRIFLVLQSSKIVGLVAPADLNKVPARASIYLLTAHFEAELAQLIRNTLHEDEAELEALLTADVLNKLRAEQTKTNATDLGLNLFYYLYLADLMTIVAKHPELRAFFGFASRAVADRELDFAGLRNRVSHLSGLLITSRDELKALNDACNKVIRLSARMHADSSG
ncbi:MAG: hypothetical protein IT320_21600 [Anaerolineae bacterium]|nr:hypothetical protein [Anaerolineae bacterium]